MSHIATNWAFQQPSIFPYMKPPEWSVLIVLADCHNPAHGCFPSQERIAKTINLDERTVRRKLSRLKQRGLVWWDESREKGKRVNNRYRLAFEEDFPSISDKKPEGRMSGGDDPFSHERNEEPEDGMSGGEIREPEDKFDKNQRAECPPNPVMEPVRKEKDIPLTGYIQKEKNASGDFDQDFDQHKHILPSQAKRPRPENTRQADDNLLESGNQSFPDATERLQNGQNRPWSGNAGGLPIIHHPESKTSSQSENRGLANGFDLFWRVYADKRGRQAAMRVWKRKRLHQIQGEVIAGAKAYAQTRGIDSRYWKQAQGWLNDGRWEDSHIDRRVYPVDRPPSGPVTVAGLAMRMALEHEKAGE